MLYFPKSVRESSIKKEFLGGPVLMLPCHLSWGWGGKSLPPICRCDIIFLVEISVVKQFSSKKWRKIPFLLLSAIFVLSFLFSPFRLATLHPRGGTDLERGYGDVPRSWPLFSGQSALPSLPIYHHCATLIPPHFQILEKFSIFSLVLVKISALKTQIFVP